MRLSIMGNVIVTITLVSIFLIAGVHGDANTTAPVFMPVAMSAGAVASNGSSAEQTTASPHSLASSNSLLASSSNISGIAWQDLLGGSYGETLSSVQQTPDGGYIACGGEGSLGGDGNVASSHGYGDVWVVKFDPTGNIQWQRSYGGNHYDQGMSIQLTSDGGYVFAGFTNSSNSGDVGQGHGGMDAWVVKLDSSGTIQWQTVLGGSKDDEAYSIRQTSDGGYIFAGVTGATITGDNNLLDHPFSGGHAWVVKLDSTGGVTWQKTYSGDNDDIASSIVQTSDGGYIFAGTTYSNNSGDVGTNHGLTDIWVVKIDSAGTIQWTKMLGGNNWDFTSPWFDDCIQQTTDKGYIVIGTTSSNSNGDVGLNHGSGDAWVIKLDSTGNITWQYPFGGSNMDWGGSIRQTPDGGYIFSGITMSSNSGDVGQGYGNGDYWVGRLDSSGTLQWQQPLGGSGYDQAESVLPTSNGGYIVSGNSYSSNSGIVTEKNHGNEDAWIVNLTPRFVINVKDSDTGAYISGANVGLYDYQNNTWTNQTSSDGPVAFNGSVGSNPFRFTDGSVFGLSVSADGYPNVNKNVTFLVTQQTVNINLTANTRPTIGKTYAIANVLSSINQGQTSIESELGNTGWGQPIFEKKDAQVTAAQFGVNPSSSDQTVNDATLFWYFGHGGPTYFLDEQGNKIPGLGNGHTYLALEQSGVNVYPSDVANKWGGKNKWVILQACYVLSDPDWGSVLGTSHGIFGYTTVTNMGGRNNELPAKFLAYAESGNTLSESWYLATQDVYRSQKVGTAFVYNPSCNCYELDNSNHLTNISAAIRFKTIEQRDNDHLPGIGKYIAPDDPNGVESVPVEWDVGNGNMVGS